MRAEVYRNGLVCTIVQRASCVSLPRPHSPESDVEIRRRAKAGGKLEDLGPNTADAVEPENGVKRAAVAKCRVESRRLQQQKRRAGT